MGITFDYKFIMNMPDDEAVSESFHSIAEDIAGYILDDVFHKLRAVGFNAFPFLCGADAFITRMTGSRLRSWKSCAGIFPMQ